MSNVNFGSVDEVINYKGLVQFNKKQKTVWKAVVWSTLYYGGLETKEFLRINLQICQLYVMKFKSSLFLDR